MSLLQEWSEALRPYMPLIQFVNMIATVVLTGIVGIGRFMESHWSRKIDEARARKEGIDPEAAEHA